MPDRNKKNAKHNHRDKSVVFEQIKDHYEDEIQKSISFIKKDVDFFTQAKAQYLLSLARRHLGKLATLRVLDVGCGVGLTDHYIVTEVGALYGIDVASGALEKAARSVPSAQYQAYDGKRMPFCQGSFDLVFGVCVLHHVCRSQWQSFVGEMARVTKRGGIVAIFEHNPFNPLTRLAVSRCSFDRDAVLVHLIKSRDLLRLAGLRIIEGSYIITVPFTGPVWRRIDRMLRKLPFGAQYYVAARK